MKWGEGWQWKTEKDKHGDEPDRGIARYFHGRVQELDKFQKRLAHAVARNSGTIFLIQAPLRSGKTALLHGCKEMARDEGWQVVQPPKGALWEYNELRKTIGLPPQGRKVKKTGGWGFTKIINFFRGSETVIDSIPQTPLRVLLEGNTPPVGRNRPGTSAKHGEKTAYYLTGGRRRHTRTPAKRNDRKADHSCGGRSGHDITDLGGTGGVQDRRKIQS